MGLGGPFRDEMECKFLYKRKFVYIWGVEKPTRRHPP